MRAFIVEQIAEHRASFDEANVRDYIDAFFVEQQLRRNDPPGSHFFIGMWVLDNASEKSFTNLSAQNYKFYLILILNLGDCSG